MKTSQRVTVPIQILQELPEMTMTRAASVIPLLVSPSFVTLFNCDLLNITQASSLDLVLILLYLQSKLFYIVGGFGCRKVLISFKMKLMLFLIILVKKPLAEINRKHQFNGLKLISGQIMSYIGKDMEAEWLQGWLIPWLNNVRDLSHWHISIPPHLGAQFAPWLQKPQPEMAPSRRQCD